MQAHLVAVVRPLANKDGEREVVVDLQQSLVNPQLRIGLSPVSEVGVVTSGARGGLTVHRGLE